MYFVKRILKAWDNFMTQNNSNISETSRCLYAFVYIGKPRSHQGHSRSAYQANPAVVNQSKAPLYCNVYYFHREHFTIDADNISKPVVDSLRGYAYKDDDLVKFRAAGKINLGDYAVTKIDLTNVPNDLLDDLFDAISNEKHFLYIEVGTFAINDFIFGR